MSYLQELVYVKLKMEETEVDLNEASLRSSSCDVPLTSDLRDLEYTPTSLTPFSLRPSMLPVGLSSNISASLYCAPVRSPLFRRAYAQKLGPVPPRNHFKIWPFILITAAGTYAYTYLVKSRLNEESQQQKNKRKRLQKNASSGPGPSQ